MKLYTLRNCLLVHDVVENKNEDTDKLVLNINNDLEIYLTEVAIDRTHHIGDQKRKVWRIHNPKRKRFTIRQHHSTGFIQRQADNFFVSNSLQESIKT